MVGQNPLQDDGMEETENPAATYDVERSADPSNGNDVFEF
eukprot:COSAG02_NODE_422_length_22587_cov_10.209089_5_plen_40_part_00